MYNIYRSLTVCLGGNSCESAIQNQTFVNLMFFKSSHIFYFYQMCLFQFFMFFRLLGFTKFSLIYGNVEIKDCQRKQRSTGHKLKNEQPVQGQYSMVETVAESLTLALL